jgi:hypothetical protein
LQVSVEPVEDLMQLQQEAAWLNGAVAAVEVWPQPVL